MIPIRMVDYDLDNRQHAPELGRRHYRRAGDPRLDLSGASWAASTSGSGTTQTADNTPVTQPATTGIGGGPSVPARPMAPPTPAPATPVKFQARRRKREPQMAPLFITRGF